MQFSIHKNNKIKMFFAEGEVHPNCFLLIEWCSGSRKIVIFFYNFLQIGIFVFFVFLSRKTFRSRIVLKPEVCSQKVKIFEDSICSNKLILIYNFHYFNEPNRILFLQVTRQRFITRFNDFSVC